MFVGSEDSWQFTAAVQAKIKGIQRSNAAGINNRRAVLRKIRFGVSEQVIRQLVIAMGRGNHELVRRTPICLNIRAILIRAEASVREADDVAVFGGNDQPIRIEIRFR